MPKNIQERRLVTAQRIAIKTQERNTY